MSLIVLVEGSTHEIRDATTHLTAGNAVSIAAGGHSLGQLGVLYRFFNSRRRSG
jgi:hypothetical protein